MRLQRVHLEFRKHRSVGRSPPPSYTIPSCHGRLIVEDWQAVAKVHGDYFGEIRPANTTMQVSRFIDLDWLVELEADAIIDDDEHDWSIVAPNRRNA